ncbi:MAG: aldo/keto reductase [Actinomycetota bacterium]
MITTETQTATVRLGEAEVPRIGLGSNRLTHTPEHLAFIREAVGAGIRHIDTAHLYTKGESESTLGEALASGSSGAVVATKGGYHPGEARPDILTAQVDESLRQLRTDSIELYYLHRVSPGIPIEDSVGALKACRDAGKIRHIGISEVGIDEIERARAVVPIAAVQNHYNFEERRHEAVVDYCTQEGIVFVPFFPLRGRAPAALERIARERGATPTQVALAWLLRRSPLMLPIPGTLSLDHVRENLASLQIALSDEEFAALR